jgi:hypothetical protein
LRQVISPSDFGLHNAIIDGKGTVHFIDFEYAGWDDLLKTEVDFSEQPCYPSPEDCKLFSLEESSVLGCVRMILQLKWKYIVLSNKLRNGSKN